MTPVEREAARSRAPCEEELRLRRALGVPDEAARVLVLQESSHWDTNWLRTSDEYFEDRIVPIFGAILTELQNEPARVFAIESVYFLKRYWEARPDRRAVLRALLASRRLRLIGASLTTPDTLLPHPESVLRDFLLGQQWLRSIGCDAYPRVAYFPDNFGHSPALPSLMTAAGVDAVAITRIDGMHFVGSDWRWPGSFPLKGSTAHTLQRKLRALDFLWRDAAGAEVLCHWNAFTYFQGDMLAHLGVIRWSGKLFGVPLRWEPYVARQLDGYVRALQPLSPTPYLFCPIGLDFNPPIEGLYALVQRYNRERSHKTGTHVVIAGLDDYFALVRCRRDALPVLELDPNPAWMGFYASRPELKTRHARAARRLLRTESALAGSGAVNELDAAWELVALSNHHDYITGTSPDRVVSEEQVPWLLRAEALIDAASGSITGTDTDSDTGTRRAPATAPSPEGRTRLSAAAALRNALRGSALRVDRAGHEVQVRTPALTLRFSEDAGGALTSLRDAAGRELLRGVGLELIAYRDTGGLWRLGHEFAGGTFDVLQRARDRHADVTVLPLRTGGVCVRIACWLDGARFVRELTVQESTPHLSLTVEGLPSARTTVTCQVELQPGLSHLTMDAAGGEVTRAHAKLYTPTFWPALSRVRAGPLALGLDAPTAVSLSEASTFEWIVARHATKERAFGVLPVLAHPIGGSVTAAQRHEAVLAFGAELPSPLAHGPIRCADPRVRVVAMKRAADGRGLIARLQTDERIDAPVELVMEGKALASAALCDAREQQLGEIAVEAGVVRLVLKHRLTTVRLVPEGASSKSAPSAAPASRERPAHTPGPATSPSG